MCSSASVASTAASPAQACSVCSKLPCLSALPSFHKLWSEMPFLTCGLQRETKERQHMKRKIQARVLEHSAPAAGSGGGPGLQLR